MARRFRAAFSLTRAWRLRTNVPPSRPSARRWRARVLRQPRLLRSRRQKARWQKIALARAYPAALPLVAGRVLAFVQEPVPMCRTIRTIAVRAESRAVRAAFATKGTATARHNRRVRSDFVNFRFDGIEAYRSVWRLAGNRGKRALSTTIVERLARPSDESEHWVLPFLPCGRRYRSVSSRQFRERGAGSVASRSLLHPSSVHRISPTIDFGICERDRA